nr:sporulation initiation factor Spo0A C-terminal domain-containing protein [bacterium]
CVKMEMGIENIPNLEVLPFAHTGTEALECIQKEKVDCLICDLLLPMLDGVELINQVRQYEDLRIIVVTALWTPSIIQAVRELGVVDAFPKPAPMDKIRSLLQNPPVKKILYSQEEQAFYRASQWMDYLGMSRRLKGFRMICLAITYASLYPCMMDRASKGVYPAVGQKLGYSPQAVERNIRTAIESLWVHADPKRLYRALGAIVAEDRGKPTNREMIAYMAELIRQEPPDYILG